MVYGVDLLGGSGWSLTRRKYKDAGTMGGAAGAVPGIGAGRREPAGATLNSLQAVQKFEEVSLGVKL